MKNTYIPSLRACALTAVAFGLALSFTACENMDINPYDVAKRDTVFVGNAPNGVKTALASYPIGSEVWTRDTTLTASVKVEQGRSLYIEPGVTVTCSADARVPVEIVVLGNLYCMGTADRPVTFRSDRGRPADWGGIICGYQSQEVVLRHVDISGAGATPTESSLSFQNKLFKTEIDGGVPAFHFCNSKGRFAVVESFFHNNYNDHTYFTGGEGVIARNVFADSGNAADGGEAINVKSGCKLDIGFNLVYNACTNAFKLSNAGTSETLPPTELRVYNNTVVNCGWRRSKNKKGGSIWMEKGSFAVLANNLVADCRFSLKQPKKDGADLSKSTLSPNWYFASTAVGVEQMSEGSDLVLRSPDDVYSATAGDGNPLFVRFAQNERMNINCEVDDPAQGAPLPFDTQWDFHLSSQSPALNGGLMVVNRLFANGLPFLGLKRVDFVDAANDQNYYFTCPAAAPHFGAFGTK